MKFFSFLLTRLVNTYREVSDAIDVGSLATLCSVDLSIMNYSTSDSVESNRIIGDLYKPIPKEWESLMTETISTQSMAPALSSVVIVEKTRKAA